MAEELYSVEQVAERLGLHVRTVRNYVRDGRLRAVKIGKQYRISREDLETLTGRPVAPPPRESARRHRHVDVSSVVQIDAVSRETADRVSTYVMTAAGTPREGDQPLRVETVYDEERASMKVIILGGLVISADLLRMISGLVEGEQ